MSIRAVIFDIYCTLLEVGSPPPDAEARWAGLWQTSTGRNAPCGLAGFARRADMEIARVHQAARAAGIPFPEVYWPDVCRAACPELAALSEGALDDFLFAHAQLQRRVTWSAGAERVLGQLKERRVVCGIASNCQPYTGREVRGVLPSGRTFEEWFDPRLCFLSFQAGFGKPDPHVFRWLTAACGCRGIAPGEILMVGDRDDNDIGPAMRQGWQGWRLAPAGEAGEGKLCGDWARLSEFLRPRIEPAEPGLSQGKGG